MKKTPFVIFLGLVLLFINMGWAQTEGKGDPEGVARELLEVSGASKQGRRVTDQIIGSQRKRMPDIPERFWDDLKAEVDPDDLNLQIIPIYAKHFTVEEMRAIIAFYKTPAGRKLLSKLSVITKESLEAGRKWEMALRMKITKRLQETDFSKLK
ncbi:MAG: DUF2059 domain-containing protein [Nitrospiria bacterium]